MRPTSLSHPAKRRDLDTTGSKTDFKALRSGTTFCAGFLGVYLYISYRRPFIVNRGSGMIARGSSLFLFSKSGTL